MLPAPRCWPGFLTPYSGSTSGRPATPALRSLWFPCQPNERTAHCGAELIRREPTQVVVVTHQFSSGDSSVLQRIRTYTARQQGTAVHARVPGTGQGPGRGPLPDHDCFHVIAIDSGRNTLDPLTVGMMRTVINVEMISRRCGRVSFAHRFRASGPAVSPTSGEVTAARARRWAASISGNSRASIRLSAAGVSSPAA